MEYKGLTSAEVRKQNSLGLQNTTIDSYTPTTLKIILKNVFSIINIVIVPLIIYLLILRLYMESLSMAMFIIINTITSVIDELRIKKEIEQLKSKFQLKAKVIRDGKEQTISISEVVSEDLVKVSEGENIIADGLIIESKVLQIDESTLTGESDYIKKENNDKVYSGSFVVTGECYYKVEAVGMNNFSNKIALASTKFEKKKSPMQLNADKLISGLVFGAIFFGLMNLLFTNSTSYDFQQRILSVTSIVSLIIPQTLIFLFTLTFSISISKLFKKGVLVQKGASIENLTNVNILCMDKTGTITTNNMTIKDVKYFNTTKKEVGEYYNSIKDELFGVNKSQKIIGEYFDDLKKIKTTDTFQIPFNSKNKFSYSETTIKNERKGLILGSSEKLNMYIDAKLRDEVGKFVRLKEDEGFRVLVAVLINNISKTRSKEVQDDDKLPKFDDSNQVIVFVIEEELNKGIVNVINQFKEQNISLKIISGDSFFSVKMIAQKVGLDTSSIVDLSEPDIDIEKAALKYTIFTRAKPEDKLRIINALKSKGNVVAMTGDGINDVLSLKTADVSIAMESGTEVTRNISDIVLLGNDYEKLPEVFFEGQNIIFNLKLTTKMFLAKSIYAILLSIFFTLIFNTVPVLPTSVLIFSFLGSSLPSYILVFTRSHVKRSTSFFKEIFLSSIPAGAVMFLTSVLEYYILKNAGIESLVINTVIVLTILGLSLIYSVVLIWEAGKLSNIFNVAIGLVIAFLVGTMQATLPIEQTDSLLLKTSLIVLFFIAGILLSILISKNFKPKQVLWKYLLYALSFVWIPIVSFLPFRTYYSVSRLEFNVWIIVFEAIIFGSILIYFMNRVFRKV